MKKLFFLLIGFLLFCSHDMYLKLDNFFLAPHSSASIKLFNGTFYESENVIDRNRMADVSMVGNGQRQQLDTTQWTEADNITVLQFETGDAGTWVAGVSTLPRSLAMSAEDFNSYLEHDGVLDMLEWRKQNNAMEDSTVEQYSKHVKTIFQVGDHRTDDYQTALGYPIEFIPLSNPYLLHAGDQMEVELLWQGKPLANQLVYVGQDHPTHSHGEAASEENHTHSHEAGEQHDHTHGVTQLRTDANGLLTIDLTADGVWHLRTIHLALSDAPGLTHESNWATLTFEVGHGHPQSETAHHHDHEASGLGIPIYVFVLVSIGLIVGLFFWFNHKKA